jgi:predicted transcriptional regulator
MLRLLFVLFFININLFGQIYVISSSNLILNNITKKELKRLFLKKTSSIRGVKVNVINNKLTYNKFNKNVLNKTPNQIHAYWMKQIFLGKQIPPPIVKNEDIALLLKNKNNIIVYSNKKLKGNILYEF